MLRFLRDAGGRSYSRYNQRAVEIEASNLQRLTPPVAITGISSRLSCQAATPKRRQYLDRNGANPFMFNQQGRKAVLPPALVILSCLFAGIALCLPVLFEVVLRLAQ